MVIRRNGFRRNVVQPFLLFLFFTILAYENSGDTPDWLTQSCVNLRHHVSLEHIYDHVLNFSKMF